MLKAACRIFICSAFVTLCLCDNYEFPKTPYPRVETREVANISSSGVKFTGSIIQLGEDPIVDHGFVWGFGSTVTPDVSHEGVVELGPRNAQGAFQAEVHSGFSAGKTYYVRAFIRTESHQVYGDAVQFVSK